MTRAYDAQSTNQKLFNRVVRFLRKQGHASSDADTCRYLAEDGSKCAVGCLISAKYYDKSFENNGIGYSSETGTKIMAAVKKSVRLKLEPDTGQLLAALQIAHDDCDDLTQEGFIDKFNEKITQIAANFNLTVPA